MRADIRDGRGRTEKDMLIGGHVADIPKPHRRKFDDRRRKRWVQFEIMMFSGMGMHYYASLSEEDNPIWNSSADKFSDGDTTGWQQAHDDTDGKGRYLSKPFATVAAAQNWIRDTFRHEFGQQTHRLRKRHTRSAPKWCYKNGD